MFKLDVLNNMQRDLWITGSLVPQHGSKILSETIFALCVITKEVYGINSQPFAVLKNPW